MGKPKVSIIWLNYNSRNFINVVLKSLEAVNDLDYPNDRYELIVVDNGSTDGSFEVINEFLERKQNIRKKIIRLGRNLGFTGGNNVGFMTRDPDSKYVILLNNDAIPFKDSLNVMVEYAEQLDVAGLNGVILRYKSNIIDTAGNFMDELLLAHLFGNGEPYPWIIRKSFQISYPVGAYALYNVESVIKCLGDRLFIDELFCYGDDHVLGLFLWECNNRLISIPKLTAEHAGSATFRLGRMDWLKWYLGVRNTIALSLISNSRWRKHVLLYALKGFITPTVSKNRLYSINLRAIYDGIRLGKRLIMKLNRMLDIYKAPIITVSKNDLFKYYILGTRRKIEFFHRMKVSSMIKYLEVE